MTRRSGGLGSGEQCERRGRDARAAPRDAYCLSTLPLELSEAREYYTSIMSRLFRALLLLTAFVALQASVLGGTAACALLGHHPTASAGAPMLGMPMPDGSMNDASASRARSAAAQEPILVSEAGSRNSADSGAPCDHSTAPEDCSAMPECSVVAVASSVVQPGSDAPAARVLPTVVLAPTFLVIPPELPPPRA